MGLLRELVKWLQIVVMVSLLLVGHMWTVAKISAAAQTTQRTTAVNKTGGRRMIAMWW